jgi:hypothetical protein
LVVPVLKYIKRIAIKSRIELTNVYKNNKYDALTFRSRDPKIPTIKNIGIKTASNSR